MMDRVSPFPVSRILIEGNPFRDRLTRSFACQTFEGTEKETDFFSAPARAMPGGRSPQYGVPASERAFRATLKGGAGK